MQNAFLFLKHIVFCTIIIIKIIVIVKRKKFKKNKHSFIIITRGYFGMVYLRLDSAKKKYFYVLDMVLKATKSFSGNAWCES